MSNLFIDTSGWASLFIPTETYHVKAADYFRLEARPGLAQCCMRLDTYGVYGPVCNYWELCSNQRPAPSSSGVTVDTPNGEVVFPTGYGIPEISTPDGGPLNVHAGPSFDTPVVGAITNGSALPLTGHIENDAWFETMDGYFIYKHHAR